MNEKLLKLLKEYKGREQNLSKLIAELSNELPVNKKKLDTAKLARVFWRQVIQDLERILR